MNNIIINNDTLKDDDLVLLINDNLNTSEINLFR